MLRGGGTIAMNPKDGCLLREPGLRSPGNESVTRCAMVTGTHARERPCERQDCETRSRLL